MIKVSPSSTGRDENHSDTGVTYNHPPLEVADELAVTTPAGGARDAATVVRARPAELQTLQRGPVIGMTPNRTREE